MASRYERRRSLRGLWVVRCPHLWSRSVTWLCLVDMGMPTKFGSSRALCPRLASSATQSRAWPSSSRLLRSRLRRSNTSCPAGSCCLHPSAGCSAPVCSSPRAAPASVPAPAPHPQQPPEAVPLSWA